MVRTRPSACLRPVYHFTPSQGWMNDPNGLVFLDGEFHLFFQHNPKDTSWGDIGWGHAVSEDLVHWRELALALPATDTGMAFSGSAVFDADNTSGFGSDSTPPLVAIYTNHRERSDGTVRQSQHLSWSSDRGRTWRAYEGNPVVDAASDSFRDPKVFWHDATGRWIMVVALAGDRRVAIYSSPDLRTWRRTGDFGSCGNTEGDWECPDLFPLTVEGEDAAVWVLKVDSTEGAVGGGSGGQYFVGDFDGECFRVAESSRTLAFPDGSRPLDYGTDFYAAITFANLGSSGTRTWLGWMNNWRYARVTPATEYRGVMAVPRDIRLVRTQAGLLLGQTPVESVETLRRQPQEWTDLEVRPGDERVLPGTSGESADIELLLCRGADAALELCLRRSSGHVTRVRIDGTQGRVSVDRREARSEPFHESFSTVCVGPIWETDELAEVRCLIDRDTLEVFVNGGTTVLSVLLFAEGDPEDIALSSRSGALVKRLSYWPLATGRPKEEGGTR